MSNEQMPRSYYSGFAGPMGIDGKTSLYVSLRCMRFEGRDLWLYAGGGLLADSNEEDEWNRLCLWQQATTLKGLCFLYCCTSS